uniref:Uncharacterized protein n=1 Tax=Arundo donax TaxID=35708 RepID=A0A0A9ANQ4_ARUDO
MIACAADSRGQRSRILGGPETTTGGATSSILAAEMAVEATTSL